MIQQDPQQFVSQKNANLEPNFQSDLRLPSQIFPVKPQNPKNLKFRSLQFEKTMKSWLNLKNDNFKAIYIVKSP